MANPLLTMISTALSAIRNEQIRNAAATGEVTEESVDDTSSIPSPLLLIKWINNNKTQNTCGFKKQYA